MVRRPASVGLGPLVDEQAQEWVAGHGAGDGERALLEVEVGRPDGAGLADAQSRAQEEGDEVG
jgi:hypothetical protein